MAVIRARGLTVRGAFTDLDLEVGAGDVVAVDDPLDVGKAALLACLTRARSADAGTLELAGLLVAVPEVTVLPLEATPASVADPEILARIGLGDRLADPIEHLSRGNRQRLVLAIALSGPADVIVADEPFAGMDPTGIDGFLDVLAGWTSSGRAALLASHSFSLVRPFTDSVVRLSQVA